MRSRTCGISSTSKSLLPHTRQEQINKSSHHLLHAPRHKLCLHLQQQQRSMAPTTPRSAVRCRQPNSWEHPCHDGPGNEGISSHATSRQPQTVGVPEATQYDTNWANQAVLPFAQIHPDESLQTLAMSHLRQTSCRSSQLHIKPCQIALGPSSPVVHKNHPLDPVVPCCCTPYRCNTQAPTSLLLTAAKGPTLPGNKSTAKPYGRVAIHHFAAVRVNRPMVPHRAKPSEASKGKAASASHAAACCPGTMD